MMKLRSCLDRTKALLAWLDLKEGERRPADPPAAIMETPTISDIHKERCTFYGLAAALHTALNEIASNAQPYTEIETLRHKLFSLERDFRQLSLPANL